MCASGPIWIVADRGACRRRFADRNGARSADLDTRPARFPTCASRRREGNRRSTRNIDALARPDDYAVHATADLHAHSLHDANGEPNACASLAGGLSAG